MGNKPLDKKVNLKEAFTTGILLDILLLAISGTIMDLGTIAMRTAFLVLAHWILSVWLVLRYRDNLGEHGRDFIRFGLLLLIVIAFVARSAMGFFLRG